MNEYKWMKHKECNLCAITCSQLCNWVCRHTCELCVPAFSVESTALRLITALGSSEVQPQFTRFLNDPKTVLSAESEELNRALILTLARATHVTGRDPARDVSIHCAAPLTPWEHMRGRCLSGKQARGSGLSSESAKGGRSSWHCHSKEIPKGFLFMDFHLYINKNISN